MWTKEKECDVMVGNVWEAENGRDVTDKPKQTTCFELKDGIRKILQE